MKAIILGLLLVSGVAHARGANTNGRMTPSKASRQIAKLVRTIGPLATSGVSEYRIEPTRNVKEAMKKLALKEGMVDSAQDFEDSWSGDNGDAWGADSAAWGEDNMANAYSYVFDPLEEESELEQDEQVKMRRAREAGKRDWELLLHTGVQFGVVPMGAVQCGVTFAALAIVDPHSGKIYVFSKEGSGC